MHGEPKKEAPQPVAEEIGRITPGMEQYIEIKAANPDCLLFYRMGDFYELFFEDAEAASRTLGIVLTKRGKHLGADIPMCGVPVHRAHEYLTRLISAGPPGAVVRRDVVRLVTRGTLTEDALLDARRNNWLMAVAQARTASEGEAAFALAWLDISTGEFHVAEVERARLAAEIARVEPGEIVLAQSLHDDPDLRALWQELPGVAAVTKDLFDGATAEQRLAAFFQVATTDAYGPFSRLELTAAAAAVGYVERTQLGQRPALSPPLREAASTVLMIDAATRANLELVRTLSGESEGSLLSVIDRSVTAAGARLLARRLASPLVDPNAIAERLDAVEHLIADARTCDTLRAARAAVPALARCRACRSVAAARATSPRSATGWPSPPPSRSRSSARCRPSLPTP